MKNLPAAYTQWATRCSSSDPAVPSPPRGPCAYDHSLVPVIVTAGQTVTYIDIVDWFGPHGRELPAAAAVTAGQRRIVYVSY